MLLIESSVLHHFFKLFLSCPPENLRQALAKVDRPELPAFGHLQLPALRLFIVIHGSSDLQAHVFQIDVLPGQAAHFSRAHAGMVGNLNRKQQVGIPFMMGKHIFQEFIFLR